MLSGATGQFYGNKYTWQFLSGMAPLLGHDRVAADDLRDQPVLAPPMV